MAKAGLGRVEFGASLGIHMGERDESLRSRLQQAKPRTQTTAN